ncbi:MAG: glycosyltransferase [Candidatus Bathyarchaeia archaeon]
MLSLTPIQSVTSTALVFVVSLMGIFGLNNCILACFRKICSYPPSLIQKGMNGCIEWPFVTIQVATYNEGPTVARLLESCLKIDYPSDKFEIIVVDDSTDETLSILMEYEKQYYPKIRVIHRESRAGYKAGALNEALKNSRGEFILVLDADSVLKPDFLKKTIPLFLANRKLGFIQGRLKYLNKKKSWLTRTLAIVNDWFVYFLQSSLSKCGMIIGFMGHGGIFRREALDDVGGWATDTIAEDLDIAYRIQLKGWDALYFENASSLEEVPPSYYSAVIRFRRHFKGSVQNLMKHWRSIIRHRSLSLFKKIEALMQLAYSLVYPLGLICLALTITTYTIVPRNIIDEFWLSPAGFLSSSLLLVFFPQIAIMIAPIPSFIVALAVSAFILLFFPGFVKILGHEILGERGGIDVMAVFGLILIWYDNMLNCLFPIANILMGRKEEWVPTERIKKRNTYADKGGRKKEFALRLAASALITLLFINILLSNLSLNSFGILLPAISWLYSAYLVIRKR